MERLCKTVFIYKSHVCYVVFLFLYLFFNIEMSSMKKITNGKGGGLFKGKPHNDKNGNPVGGIKAVVVDTNQPIEVENNEALLTKEATEQNWERLSEINQSSGNGVAISAPTSLSNSGTTKKKKTIRKAKSVVTDKKGIVKVESGQSIINKSATKEHWKELSAINESAGGLPIANPNEVMADVEEYKKGGNVDFNPNVLPKKSVHRYALSIKSKYPEIWNLGTDKYGTAAFENLDRVLNRGHWLNDEEWFYGKWKKVSSRNKSDTEVNDVIANLKWLNVVDKGFDYMKEVISSEIKNRGIENRGRKKIAPVMEQGGRIDISEFETENKLLFQCLTTIRDLVSEHCKITDSFIDTVNNNYVIHFEKEILYFDTIVEGTVPTLTTCEEVLDIKGLKLHKTYLSIPLKVSMAKGGNVTDYPIAPIGEWYGDADYEKRGGKMVKMSPQEYLKLVRTLTIDEGSRDNIDDLKNHILSGKTLDPLTIYSDGKEDGRHRANAAIELGIKEVPVIIFDKGGNVEVKSHQQLFQERLIAAQQLSKSLGGRLKINSDASVKVYHGTHAENEKKILESGVLNSGTYFSKNAGGTKDGDSPLSVANRKFGKDGVVMELNILAKDLEPAAAGSEIYTPHILYKNQHGVWSSDVENKAEKGGELAKGVEVEKEHTDTLKKLYKHEIQLKEAPKFIAKDHLKEDEHYYTKLAQTEGLNKGGKVATVMGEFKSGTLKTSHGEKVTDEKRALAIALSEQRAYDSGKMEKGGEVEKIDENKIHSNEDELYKLKSGIVIISEWLPEFSFFRHAGIVSVENDIPYVYDNDPENKFNNEGGSVNKVLLSEYLKTQKVIEYYDSGLSSDEIRDRVKKYLGVKFNWITFNCETFIEKVTEKPIKRNGFHPIETLGLIAAASVFILKEGGKVDKLDEVEIISKIKAAFNKSKISDYLEDMPTSVKKLWSYLRKKESSSTGMDVKFDNKDVRDFFHYAYRALYGKQYGDNNMDFKDFFIKKWGQKSFDAIEMMHDSKRMRLKNQGFISITTNNYGRGALEYITFHFPQIFSGIEANVKFYIAAKNKPESERNSGEVMIIEEVEQILKTADDESEKMESGGAVDSSSSLFSTEWIVKKAEHGALITNSETIFGDWK